MIWLVVILVVVLASIAFVAYKVIKFLLDLVIEAKNRCNILEDENKELKDKLEATSKAARESK